MRYLLSLITTLTLTLAFATSYTPTSAYAIKFATAKAEGTFRGLKGKINFDATDLAAANFDVWVDAATISTGNTSKDNHARGSSWLDVANHPRISFKSSKFVKAKTGYAVSGSVTIRGVSKAVTIPFTFTDNVFSGATTVNRQDFGVEGPFLFGSLVGDDIVVSLSIPVK
jgi:polyisoprenoid-binding protein YceI